MPKVRSTAFYNQYNLLGPGMKTRTVLVMSSVFWVGWAAYAESVVLVAIAVTFHIIFWHLHRIEVKINRLLDSQRVHVTDAEIAE